MLLMSGGGGRGCFLFLLFLTQGSDIFLMDPED
jgi:hypothetical protein